MDKEFMDIFYELAKDEEYQIPAVKELIKSVNAENIEYTWKRLVKGLPSNRKKARQGFAIALSEILKNNDCINTEDVYNLCKAVNTPESNAYYKHARNLFSGLVFGVAALLRSGRLNNSSLSFQILGDIQRIVFKKKSTVKDAGFKVLIDILDLLNDGDIIKAVEIFTDELCKGWASCSLERLSLCLYFEQRNYSFVSKILKKHWNFSHLSHPQNYDKISSVLKATHCESFSSVQMITLVKCLHKSKSFSLKKLGKYVFKLSEDGQNKSSVMFLLTEFTKCCNDDEFYTIFNKYTSKYLKKSYDKSPQGVKILTDTTIKSIKTIEDKDVLAKISSKILLEMPVRQCGNFLVFDAIVKHQSEAMQAELVPILEELFVSPPSIEMDAKQKDKSITLFRNNCISWLYDLTRTIDSKQLFDFVKFLFIYSFFDVQDEIESFPRVKKPAIAMSMKTRDFTKTKFNASLKILTSFTSNTGGLAEDGRFWMYHLLSSSLSLITNDRSPLLDDFSLNDEWRSFWVIIDDIESKPPADRSDQDRAFELLLLNAGVLMFEDYKHAKVLVNDVLECYDNRTVDKQENWQLAFVDLLLALMSYESSFLRNVVCHCFRYVSRNLNRQSLDLILDAIEGKEMEEEAPGSESIKDDNDNNNEKDSENESMDKEDVEESEDDEESEKSEVMECTLGADDDDDDVNLSDANDEELVAEDRMLTASMQVLAKYRKEKRKDKKERTLKKTEQIQFKSKIMDLVDIFLHEVGLNSISNDIPIRLLCLMNVTPSDKPLHDKIRTLFKKIQNFKSEKITAKAEEVSESSIISVQRLISKSPNKEVRSFALKFLCMLCKIYATDNCQSRKKRRKSISPKFCNTFSLVSPLVDSFVNDKNTRVNKAIICDLVERISSIKADVLVSLCEQLDGDKTPYSKFQCVGVINRIYSFADKEVFGRNTLVISYVSKFLAELHGLENPSPNHIRECLTLLQKIVSSSKKQNIPVPKDLKLTEILGQVQLQPITVKYNDIAHLANKLIPTFDD